MLLLSHVIFLILWTGWTSTSDPRLAELDEDTREMLQMLRDSCIEQTGVDESLINKARDGDFSEDASFKNYLGCVYQQLGAISDDGVADYDAMLALLPEQFMERATKMVNQCRHVRENTAANTAFVLNKCLYKTDPEYYFII